MSNRFNDVNGNVDVNGNLDVNANFMKGNTETNYINGNIDPNYISPNFHRSANANRQKKKIYIGNISYELDTPQLQEVFSIYGEIIDAVVIKDRESGTSRGFGFVTFTTTDSAQQAVSEMHGAELAGRELRVKLAQEKEAKPVDSF